MSSQSGTVVVVLDVVLVRVVLVLEVDVVLGRSVVVVVPRHFVGPHCGPQKPVVQEPPPGSGRGVVGADGAQSIV